MLIDEHTFPGVHMARRVTGAHLQRGAGIRETELVEGGDWRSTPTSGRERVA